MMLKAVRDRLLAAAVTLGEAAHYKGLGTVEFLVGDGPEPDILFIEANPRLQVEHTVTEAVTGLDLVRLQLEIAQGATLADLGLSPGQTPAVRGVAVQVRVNLETMTAQGDARPTGGVLTVFEPPSGPGVRVDGFGYAGYATSARYDSLLAKLIVHTPQPDRAAALAKERRALSQFRIEGAQTNMGFLDRLLAHPAVVAGDTHTRFIESAMAELVDAADRPKLFFEGAAAPSQPRGPGARVDAGDPLAVLAHGKSGGDLCSPRERES